MQKRQCALAFFAVMSTTSIFGICAARGDNYCDVVLTTRAFDYFDSSFTSHLENAVFDFMCQKDWSQRQSQEDQSQSFGGGGSYADIYKGFFDTAKSRGVSSSEINYHNLCRQRDFRLLSALSAATHSQYADHAVDAWSKCVETQTGLFTAITPVTDANKFSITVHYRPASSNDKLVFLGYDKERGFTCKLKDGDNNLDGYSPADHGFGEKYILSCNKTKDANVEVAINTNAGTNTIGVFNLISDQYKELADDVKKLKQQQSAEAIGRRLQVFSNDSEHRMACNAYSKWQQANPGTEPWPHAIVKQECPSGWVRMSGGCDFTCFDLQHTESIPSENGWQCGAISTDKDRTFGAYTICLRSP
jgi:hypothetical protein